MVDISIRDDRVLFRVEGLHKLWAMRSELDIPLAHVVDVEINHDQIGQWWHGFKLIGTDAPGLFAAGTFYYHGELVFWEPAFDLNRAILGGQVVALVALLVLGSIKRSRRR